MFKRICIAAMVLMLASCAVHPRRGASPGHASSSSSITSLPGAGTYQIDADQSELRVLVYRGGTLAHLGHNHVLVNRALSGSVRVGETVQSSSVTFSVPVAQFVVDDAQARREEGADFPGEVPEDAKAGTLHNLLSATQLNAAMFATLSVTSVSLDNSPSGAAATLQVNVAGRESTVTAPFSLHLEPQGLSVAANFALLQSAVGIKPYSLFGGALQVEDSMQIKIRIVASRR